MRTGAKEIITLELRDVSQLFSRRDALPLTERAIDRAAAESIASRCRDRPPGGMLELAILLADPLANEAPEGVEGALRSHFAVRAEIKRRELAQLMRRGRLSLCAGSVFLAICLLLGGLVAGLGSNAAIGIVREGLTICGWVAMWKPLEIYIYDWWPLWEECRQLDRLSQVHVRIARAASSMSHAVESYNGDGVSRAAA